MHDNKVLLRRSPITQSLHCCNRQGGNLVCGTLTVEKSKQPLLTMQLLCITVHHEYGELLQKTQCYVVGVALIHLLLHHRAACSAAHLQEM
jgi:hypothetical protein